LHHECMIQQQCSGVGFRKPSMSTDSICRSLRYSHPVMANTIEYVITQNPQGFRIFPFLPILT